MTDLAELLHARSGIVCAVGAGGKKSVLFALAGGASGRTAFTTTVHSLPPPDTLAARVVIASRRLLAERLREAGAVPFVAYACPGGKSGRLTGVPPEVIDALHVTLGFELTLVKADGARMRWVKAPSPDEPVLPPGTTTVIPVMSARALGEPLTERTAHRVERLAMMTGTVPGRNFSSIHAARLLTSEHGMLKDVGSARVVPVINMVDDPARQRLATEVAMRALDLTNRFERVVLTCFKSTEPVVAVIGR